MTTRAKPVLVYIPWSGMGDLIMALPLLSSLRDHYTVLPVTQRHHTDLINILQEDGILDTGLPVVSNLRVRTNPNAALQGIRQINRLAPEVVLIYGKRIFAAAAIAGLIRSERIIFSSLVRRARRPDAGAGWTPRHLHCLPSSGNQVEDNWRFADHLGHERREQRWRLSPEAIKSVIQAVPERLADRKYVVVAPWTSAPRRDADLIYFKQAIEYVVKDLGLPVAITGTAANAASACHLLEGIPEAMVFNLVGATSAAEFLGIIAGAHFLVANDSGNMHLATLVKTPSVIFFSDTRADFLVSEEWYNNMTAIQFPLTMSGHRARISEIERGSILNDRIPKALHEVCQEE